jgi:hypothetical protein
MFVMRGHCCDGMRTHVQIPPAPSEVVDDRPVLYDPVFDEYRLVSACRMADRTVIAWCPWCGTALPPSQREAWFAALASTGLAPDGPLPDRFLTDAWRAD